MLLFLAPLLFVNLIFDYAKVRAVVEDRRSMIGALVAGWRFVRRHPGAAIGLYALDALLFLSVIGVYFLAAPGANHERARVRGRTALHRAAGDRAAAVCRLADRLVPGPAGARRLRGAAGAEVAGFSRRRSARALAVDERVDAAAAAAACRSFSLASTAVARSSGSASSRAHSSSFAAKRVRCISPMA